MSTHGELIKKFIKMGSNSSVMLLTLIEEILDLSKMEAGTFHVVISKFSIKELIEEVTDIFDNQCHQKGIELKVDVSKHLQRLYLESDRGRIKQIFLNLLSNSFKFTFQGYIKITA